MRHGKKPVGWWFGAVLGFATLGLGACVPHFDSYSYLSLKGYPDARLIQRARALPGEARLPVRDIPVLYEIRRETYTIRFEIDPATPTPTTLIRVVPVDDTMLGVEPDRSAEPSACSHWVVRDHAPISAPVQWSHRPDCGPTDAPIRFKVVRDDGTVAGEEAIPYAIKKGGVFMYYDAI